MSVCRKLTVRAFPAHAATLKLGSHPTKVALRENCWVRREIASLERAFLLASAEVFIELSLHTMMLSNYANAIRWHGTCTSMAKVGQNHYWTRPRSVVKKSSSCMH